MDRKMGQTGVLKKGGGAPRRTRPEVATSLAEALRCAWNLVLGEGWKNDSEGWLTPD